MRICGGFVQAKGENQGLLTVAEAGYKRNDDV